MRLELKWERLEVWGISPPPCYTFKSGTLAFVFNWMGVVLQECYTCYTYTFSSPFSVLSVATVVASCNFLCYTYLIHSFIFILRKVKCSTCSRGDIPWMIYVSMGRGGFVLNPCSKFTDRGRRGKTALR
jgi:hypothetical protein